MTSDRPLSPPAGMTSPAERNRTGQGVLFGLAAYGLWGSFPLFFKTLVAVPPLEILCHRISWAALFLFLLVCGRRQLGAFLAALRDRKVLLTLCASTLLIATNWLTFLYAIARGEVLMSSLGYFMTPLVSTFLGCLILRERLTRWQQVSVAFALVGVLNLTFSLQRLPWIALVLAGSFGLYGLLRKLARVEAMVGQSLETMLLAPFSLVYLLLLAQDGQGHFLTHSSSHNLLLPLSGVVTAIPLLFFVGAARRLRLTTIGFLQYITPSLHFLLAVGLYGEAFTTPHLVSFLSIWVALGLYSMDAIWSNRPQRAYRATGNDR